MSALNCALVRSQLLALQGDARATLTQIDAALRKAELADHRLFEHTPRYLQGVTEGGAAGTERCARSLAFFAEQGWKAPRKAARMLCPAVEMLETAR